MGRRGTHVANTQKSSLTNSNMTAKHLSRGQTVKQLGKVPWKARLCARRGGGFQGKTPRREKGRPQALSFQGMVCTTSGEVKQNKVGQEPRCSALALEGPWLTPSCHTSPRVEAGVRTLPVPHRREVLRTRSHRAPTRPPRNPLRALCASSGRARRAGARAHLPARGPARPAAGAG